MSLPHRFVLIPLLLAGTIPSSVLAEAQALPEATAPKLPRWRGFNLLEMFNAGNHKPFREEDFRLISKLGFNFVRLPLDYRCWTKNNNWEEFDESVLQRLDQAVAFGKTYGVHVCLNLHRAPGYTVASPPEKLSLWTDPEARRVCALHWKMLAARFRGVPNSHLSFNLLNEPADVKPEIYREVVTLLAEAIRSEDQTRLIIADGLEWGRNPLPDASQLGIALATRGYDPMDISHYKAEWVRMNFASQPSWPRPLPPNGVLLAPSKKEGSHPLVIDGPFAETTNLRLHVMTVSTAATLVVEADGKPIFTKDFKPGPGEGEWKKVVHEPRWNIYQNLYDRDYTATIPQGTSRAVIRVTSGDWLQLGELGFGSAGKAESKLTLKSAYGAPATPPFRFAPDSKSGPFIGLPMENREWLRDHNLAPWIAARKTGAGVIVGEWGAYNKTPHPVFLAWAEDNLANWKEAGIGWSLWNFRGSFGLLDSGRQDVNYESFEGHQLDRQLLDLLQKY